MKIPEIKTNDKDKEAQDFVKKVEAKLFTSLGVPKEYIHNENDRPVYPRKETNQ